MKTNMKTKNYFKYAKVLLASAVLLALAACGDKGGNNNNVNNQGNIGLYNQCPNCQNLNGSALFAAESVDSYGMIRFNWIFTGSNLQAQTYPQQYTHTQQVPYNNQQVYGGGYYGQTQGSYVGPVGVTGSLSISQAINLGYCQLPAGVYTLNTIQPGNWQSSMVNNLRMQAIGPVAINLSLTQGQVSSPGYLAAGQVSSSSATSGRMFANVMIESVGGYNCQMAILVQ